MSNKATLSPPINISFKTLYLAPAPSTKPILTRPTMGNSICKSVMGQGAMLHFGKAAALQMGNVTVIVVSRRAQPRDDGLMEIFGMDYHNSRIIGLKSSQHYKAWWAERCDLTITADPPGIHCSDLNCFKFKHASTQRYPFADVQWNG